MNNINPFVPQGSVLEQNKRRSRMKLAVFCVLAVSVAGLSAVLINGCTREKNNETSQVDHKIRRRLNRPIPRRLNRPIRPPV